MNCIITPAQNSSDSMLQMNATPKDYGNLVSLPLMYDPYLHSNMVQCGL
jgi:hypothetical protein